MPKRILLVTRSLAPLTGQDAEAVAQATRLRELARQGHDVRAVIPAPALAQDVAGLSPLIEALIVPGHGVAVGVKVAALAPDIPVYVLEGGHLSEPDALRSAIQAMATRLSWYPDDVLYAGAAS